MRDWVTAARDLVFKGGIRNLTLRALAESLGVTTGAFYTRFKGIEDIHEALRSDWIACNVTPFDTAIAAAGADGLRQYLSYVRVLILEDDFLPSYENAMRDWATSSDETAALLARVEEHRIAQLRGMFEALGFSGHEADIRAKVTYFHQVGYTAMQIAETRDERLQNFPHYARILAEIPHFLSLHGVDAIRDAILKGSDPETKT
jgi:AcrR family transcriptional regulator